MTHLREVDAAERARALAGGGVYGGGYAFADKAPVLVFDKPETDAEARARLAQEVGRLTAEVRTLRASLQLALNGDAREAAKCGGTPVGVTIDGADVTVMLIDDDPDCDAFADSVWTGTHWLNSDYLTDDFKEAATKAALKQLAEDARP